MTGKDEIKLVTEIAEKMLAESRRLAGIQGQHLEAYIRLYMESTNFTIDELELVEQRNGDTFTWYVQPRKIKP